MASAIDATNSEEKQLPDKRETMIWKPRKECLLGNVPDVPDNKSEESEDDVSGSPEVWYNIHSCLGEWDEVPSTPESPKLQDASGYELEDWDKELEESACFPYDADDLPCGSSQENSPLASYMWKEDWFYNPSCHHRACFASPPPAGRKVEQGQFDDADE